MTAFRGVNDRCHTFVRAEYRETLDKKEKGS
jgi:hypothetical protein